MGKEIHHAFDFLFSRSTKKECPESVRTIPEKLRNNIFFKYRFIKHLFFKHFERNQK